MHLSLCFLRKIIVLMLCLSARQILSAAVWVDVQKKARNAMAQIFSHRAERSLREPHKPPKQKEACGSGFLLDPRFIGEEGYIATNFHVIDQASGVEIQLPFFGKERFDATIVGVSPERDVALLKLSDENIIYIKSHRDMIPSVPLGDSDSVVKAQKIAALGYPLGQETLKITLGCVSGRQQVMGQSYIQIDAAISPGNSGGPSFNSAGEVIGINTSVSAVFLAQNIGWIIPIDDVKKVLIDLKETKILHRPVFGAEFCPANKALISYENNPGEGGFYVTRVYENTSFASHGLQAGDMLYEINGIRVDRYGELNVPWSDDKVSIYDLVNRFTFGDEVSIVFYRGSERKEIRFTLTEFILPIRQVYPGFEELDYEIIGGMEVMELTLNHIDIFAQNNLGLLKYIHTQNQYKPKIILTNVFQNSQTQKARSLFEGSIIEEVNGENVSTLDEFRIAIKKSVNTGFIDVRTAGKKRMVLALDEVLADEQWLQYMHGYQKTRLVEELEELYGVKDIFSLTSFRNEILQLEREQVTIF